MVNTFWADPAVGGDNSTTTDDDNPTTGLGDDGFRLRLLPMFTNVVNIANYLKGLSVTMQAALTAATAAAASAINAAAAMGTSATSQTIAGSGSMTFVTQSGKNWQPTQFVLIGSSASVSNWMLAQVTSYSGTSLQVSIVASNGAGTIAAWNISLASPPSNVVSGAFAAGQSVAFTGDITAAGVTGAFNDWAPTGLATAAVIRAATTGAATLTGLSGGADGRLLLLQNTGSANLTLAINSASSAAANRFAPLATGQTTLVLRAGQTALLQYDATSALWRLLSGSGVAVQAAIWAASDYGAYITPGDLKDSAAFQTLTDAATIAWNVATQGYNARVTLTASGHTMGAPSGLYDGQSISLEVIQDATGGRTMIWTTGAGGWDFGAANVPTLQTGANKADRVFGQYNARTNRVEASYRKGA